MRKSRWLIGSAILALLIGATTAWATGSASNGTNTQEITLKTKPTKLPNKKPKGVGLGTLVSVTRTGDPGGVADPAKRVVLNYDDAYKFKPSKFPVCTANLENTSDEQAKKLCKKAQVGQGQAVVRLPTPNGAADIPAVVTAFNGPKATDSQGNTGPGLILHTYVPQLGITTILPGVLSGSRVGGDFGQALNVDVPDLAGGAGSIKTFEANIKAKIKKGKGKKAKKFDYVAAKCNDADKQLDVQAVFDYKTTPQIVVGDTVPCTAKKK